MANGKWQMANGKWQMVDRDMEDNKAKKIRPTKKQKAMLGFIDEFIKEHGYSPSYREIMRGCNYTSVATVALHINNLIARGHLSKRDNSARSLEVVTSSGNPQKTTTNYISDSEEKWLVEKVEHFFSQAEAASSVDPAAVDQLYVLIGALKVLGLEGAAQSFMPRLANIKDRSPKG